MKQHLLWLGWFASLSISVAVAQEPVLRAGMHAEDVTPPIGVPLAGFGGGERRLIPWDMFNKHPYATYLAPTTGSLDPIRSKVLVLDRADERLFFVSLDIVGADPMLRNDLVRELSDIGVRQENFVMSATHTHSGPGAIFKNRVWEFLAADKFNTKIYRQFLAGVATSVRNAVAKLEPASLLASGFEAEGLQNNRRDPNGPVDRDANMLWVRSSDGRWLGAIANLAIHGTALGMKNHLFSSDVLGAIERELESRLSEFNRVSVLTGEPPVVLYINAAEGDIKPAQTMEASGRMFAEQALDSLEDARNIGAEWSVSRRNVRLPMAFLNLKGCVEQKSIQKFILSGLRLYLGPLLNRDTHVLSIRLGDMVMMTWPGEPTTLLGLELRRLAREAGVDQAWVLGLTNDHMAYFTTPEEYAHSSYESCSSLHGAEGTTRLLDAHASMLAR
jgi:hypothetical protein